MAVPGLFLGYRRTHGRREHGFTSSTGAAPKPPQSSCNGLHDAMPLLIFIVIFVGNVTFLHLNTVCMKMELAL